MRTIPAAIALLVAAGGTAAAQATRDQARIAFTFSIGYSMPRDLWSVPAQAVLDNPFPADTFALSRRIRPALTFGMSGIYFPGDHLGYLGEAYLLGVGFEDACHLTTNSGSLRNQQVCNSINIGEHPATAVAMNAGIIYRVASRGIISPYAKVAAGFLFMTQSSVRTAGDYPLPDMSGQMSEVIVYTDDHDSRVSPTGVLGVGFTTAVGHAYQIRWEVRDNIAPVRSVNGSTVVDGLAPPVVTRIKNIISFNVGFDVVLERRRGHRY